MPSSDPVDSAAEPLRCDCEPHVWPDGSKSHEEECAIYPQCPHEVVHAVCFMPCRCSCKTCQALSEAHEMDKIK